jgi:hypothetical protein
MRGQSASDTSKQEKDQGICRQHCRWKILPGRKCEQQAGQIFPIIMLGGDREGLLT